MVEGDWGDCVRACRETYDSDSIIRSTVNELGNNLFSGINSELGSTYKRRGGGAEIQANALVWVGLSISAVALITFLLIRPSQKSS